MDSTAHASPSEAEYFSPQQHHWRAETEMAEALSEFQAQLQPARELTLLAVIEAAKPAFQRGFSFSVRSGSSGTTVLLLHKGGAQQSAEDDNYDADFSISARLLAGLLGIPVAPMPCPSKDEDALPVQAAEPALSLVGVPAGGQLLAPREQFAEAPAALEPEELEEDFDPELEPEPTGQDSALDPQLEPLSAEEIATLTGMLKAMARNDKESWKRFTIAFRAHFQVPSAARTITDRVTQRRHADFIDRFERELTGQVG
jgi:hypothetical protein